MSDLLDDDGPGIQCSDCGHVNPSYETICQACNCRLDYVRTSDKPDGEASYSRYRQIRQKCDEARDGIITMDQFTAYLQDLTHILETRAKAIYDNFEATNYYEDNSDEINVGLEGVQQYEAGVSELWSFASDGDVGRIDPALQLIWDGNQRIVEAMRINRENRAALADLWETLRAPE